jgi:hypothetical protein
MKKHLLSIFLTLCSITYLQAQNPYQSLGVEVEVLTLSKGKYKEFHPNDTLVQIGTVLFNTITGEVVAFVEIDTLYSEATLEPEIVSRWMSPDPLADEFPSWSPYNFVLNNPIKLVDPDGRAPVWIVGSDGQRVTYNRDASGNITWSANASADVQRVGNAMLYTETGTRMLDAMVNSEVRITLEVSSDARHNSNGNPVRGVTQYTDYSKDADGNYEVKSANITIYEGSLQEDRQNNPESNYYKALNTDDKAIAATAGHEAHHATDSENANRSLQQQLDNRPYPEREDKPQEVQKNIAIETYRKDREDRN